MTEDEEEILKKLMQDKKVFIWQISADFDKDGKPTRIPHFFTQFIGIGKDVDDARKTILYNIGIKDIKDYISLHEPDLTNVDMSYFVNNAIHNDAKQFIENHSTKIDETQIN